MAALQVDSKCTSHPAGGETALLIRLAPCPQTQSEVLKPLLVTALEKMSKIYNN
jgi:hypothetical protein